MPTRRTVLKHGGCAVLASAVPLAIFKARAATTAPFDYYISTAGSDGNAGTLSSPWAITSLQRSNANNAKIAGKRVGIISGTYAIYSHYQSSAYNDPTLNIPNGSSGSPTYVELAIQTETTPRAQCKSRQVLRALPGADYRPRALGP